MRAYRADHGCFPPAFTVDASGQRSHSWRALLLPYVDQSLANRYRLSEPWNGPNNSKLRLEMPALFACPASGARDEGMTSYFVPIGDEYLYSRAGEARSEDRAHSFTVIVFEDGSHEMNWLEPGDDRVDIVDALSGKERHRNYHEGVSVGYARGGWDCYSFPIETDMLGLLLKPVKPNSP
jgi:hypothetical protein